MTLYFIILYFIFINFLLERKWAFDKYLLNNIDREELIDTDHFVSTMDRILSNSINDLFLLYLMNIATILWLLNLIRGIEPGGRRA